MFALSVLLTGHSGTEPPGCRPGGASRAPGLNGAFLVAVCAVLVGLGFGMSACASDPPEPPSKGDLGKIFAQCAPVPPGTAAPAAKPPSRPSVSLYLDRSQSMRGFVAASPSRYESVMEHLLRTTATAGFDLHPYEFSTMVQPLTAANLEKEVRQPGFYNGGDTMLSGAVSEVAKDQGDVAIMVTDLVQSEPGQGTSALVRAFRELADERRVVVLLAFRSAFRGNYFVESRPGAPYSLSLDQDDGHTTGRPFYVIVAARSRAAYLDLRRYVIEGMGMAHEFEAALPAFQVQQTVGQEAVRQAPSDAGDSLWNRSSAAELWTCRDDSPAVLARFSERRAPDSSRAEISLIVQGQWKLPVGSVDRVAWEISDARRFAQRRWQGLARDARVEEIREEKDRASVRTTGMARLRLRVSAPRPPRDAWDVYEIRVSAAGGLLASPEWVRDWSTNDDADSVNGNRTLGLAVVVEAVTRAISENVPWFHLNLCLGRGAR